MCTFYGLPLDQRIAVPFALPEKNAEKRETTASAKAMRKFFAVEKKCLAVAFGYASRKILFAGRKEGCER
jgi:hypothetical protein